VGAGQHGIDFTDIQSWKTALSSISDKEYGFLEFHANSFAGLVLVPPEDLDEKFIQCKDMLRNNGMEVTSDTPGLTDIIEDYIADHFAVSRRLHRRSFCCIYECHPPQDGSGRPLARFLVEWHSAAE